MPPKAKFTKDEIIEAALNIVRTNGFKALTARSLGARLGSSPRPVFTIFKGMEDIQQEVLSAANVMYHNYLQEDMADGKYPAYKASGIAYIRFAKEEAELFKLLFMRDRSNEKIEENREEIRPLIELIMENTGLSEDDAYLLHIEMWIYVHGIATMTATSYLDFDMEFTGRIITDVYEGLKYRFISKEEK